MCAPSHDVSGIGQSVQAASVVRQCSGCQGLRGTGAGGMEDRGTGVGDMRDGGHWGGARGRRGVPTAHRAHRAHLTKQLFRNQQGSDSGEMRKD